MKRINYRFLLLLSFFLTVECVRARPEGIRRPDIKGKILGTNGLPIAEATVLVYSAGPRIGSSTLCPTCYPDCRKKANTDEGGNFQIQSLDPNLVFRLLVIEKNSKPLFVRRVDPLNGATEIRIEPRKTDFPAHRALRGRVVDAEGKPVAHAIINFDFFMGLESNCGGQCDGVDMVSVADRDGRFILGAEKQFERMTIIVEAPGFARRKFFDLNSEKTHELKLTEGAIVTGRVMRDGKGAKGIAVGLVSVDRSENFTGNFDTRTDEGGNFTLLNIPPFQIYYVYSLIGSDKEGRVVPTQRIRVSGDASTRDVGALGLEPGVRLHGKVTVSDGSTLPPNLKIGIGRQGPWDGHQVPLQSDGTFDATGLPRESISVSLQVPGYRFSDKNKSIDWLNGGSIIGRIEGDSSVEILLEPGNFQRPDFSNQSHIQQMTDAHPESQRLEGITPNTL